MVLTGVTQLCFLELLIFQEACPGLSSRLRQEAKERRTNGPADTTSLHLELVNGSAKASLIEKHGKKVPPKSRRYTIT